jgi:acetylglutamate kinase
VDGLRITDEATLGVVVSVLAGEVNTRFGTELTTAGVAEVGDSSLPHNPLHAHS